MNTAIIVAAGSGQRFGSSQLKQFAPILGKPLIIHTLDAFDSCPDVDEIVLVLSDDGRDEFERISGGLHVAKPNRVVTGATSRAGSVLCGLDTIDAAKAAIVAVHDGARPLVTGDEISRTIEAARLSGAACLVAEVTDTIKEVNGVHIVRTIDREHLRRALTPQAFRYDLLRRAFEGVTPDESITDECSLVERLGFKITYVEGSSRNIKVTRPEDAIMAAAFLKDQ